MCVVIGWPIYYRGNGGWNVRSLSTTLWLESKMAARCCPDYHTPVWPGLGRIVMDGRSVLCDDNGGSLPTSGLSGFYSHTPLTCDKVGGIMPSLILVCVSSWGIRIIPVKASHLIVQASRGKGKGYGHLMVLVWHWRRFVGSFCFRSFPYYYSVGERRSREANGSAKQRQTASVWVKATRLVYFSLGVSQSLLYRWGVVSRKPDQPSRG